MECFLSILIRYRRVYGMVVFSEFCGRVRFQRRRETSIRGSCLGFEPKKRRRLRCLQKQSSSSPTQTNNTLCDDDEQEEEERKKRDEGLIYRVGR